MEEQRAARTEEVDIDKPAPSLPLWLERLLEQLEKAAGEGTLPVAEAGERQISFDLLRAASRVKPPELRLRPDRLGERKWSILKEESDKAKKEAWSNGQGAEPYGNIRGYVRNARLPPLPWCLEISKAELAKETGDLAVKETTRGSTNTFATTGTFTQAKKGGQTTQRKPDCVRKLRRIEKIPYEDFIARVQEFSDTLPEGFQPAPDGVESMQPGLWDGDIGQDEFLSLKADGFKTRDYVLKNPDTEKRVEEWIESFPAMTATRVLHVCDSDTLGWAYQRVHGKGTKGKLSDLCWQRVPPGNSGVEEETMRRLVLEVKPPWVLDLESFKAFVDTPKLPSSDEIRKARGVGSAPPLNVDWTTPRENPSDLTSQAMEQPSIRFSKVQNIWAQIYDYCVIQGNFFFILSTYEHWAFGVFSADYTEARVTDPLPYDLSQPNILECLLYWTQSARLVPGMFEIPWPTLSESNTADTPPIDLVVICIKNYALLIRRIFQDAQNRARRTPASNTTITPTEKLEPKLGPPYIVACRLAACLGRVSDLTQHGGQKEYDERWLEYFREGLRLKSESQEDYEEQDERLDRLLKELNASGGDESWEAHQEELGEIDFTLQYDPATDGYEPDQRSSASVQARVAADHLQTKFGIPQVFHGSVPSSHGLQVAPLSLPSTSASTSPRTPSSLLSAPCSSPPGPHSRFLSPSLSNDWVNPEAQPRSGIRSSLKRAGSSSEDRESKRPRTRK